MRRQENTYILSRAQGVGLAVGVSTKDERSRNLLCTGLRTEFQWHLNLRPEHELFPQAGKPLPSCSRD